MTDRYHGSGTRGLDLTSHRTTRWQDVRSNGRYVVAMHCGTPYGAARGRRLLPSCICQHAAAGRVARRVTQVAGQHRKGVPQLHRHNDIARSDLHICQRVVLCEVRSSPRCAASVIAVPSAEGPLGSDAARDRR